MLVIGPLVAVAIEFVGGGVLDAPFCFGPGGVNKEAGPKALRKLQHSCNF